MFEALALAFALAMDAAAVSAARGMAERGEKKGMAAEAVILPLLFGAFQAGMAALGWWLGAWGGKYIERWDHWIAFGLLTFIGGKMLYDAWRGREDGEETRSGWLLYIALAIATSIDAAAAGITLPMLDVGPVLAVVFIGVITAVCCAIGYLVGRRIGGRKLEIVGGVVLIAIGVKLLVDHL
jgi:putative Mn2+ efflux pump MntP